VVSIYINILSLLRVREACMEGMVSFTKSIAEQTPQLLSPDQ